MSLAKYMKLYKDYGFFNSSIVRVRITDTSFFGSDLILSKDGQVLRTRTIDGEVTDISTDESGVLTLSADNGTSTLSGTVTIEAYGTYNITLTGGDDDREREVYASKNVTLDAQHSTDTVSIGYTGDIASISAVSSNPSVCNVSVSGHNVIVTDAGKDFNGRSTITATVSRTSGYDAGEVNFYVNKTNGSLGTWEDASDEVIASMIAQADAGEIDLSDYWNVGDIRTVHLNEVAAGTAVSAQPEQDMELVLLHNPEDSSYYRLTTPTSGFRYQPNFIIGTLDCLKNTSAMGYFQKAITATYGGSGSYTKTNTSYAVADGNNEAELIQWLNDDFYNSLPSFLKSSIKNVDRRYVCSEVLNTRSVYDDYVSYTSQGTKSEKISIINLKELGFSSALAKNGNYYMPTGVGVYNSSGQFDSTTSHQTSQWAAGVANNAVNNCGIKFDYYTNGGRIKKKRGIDGVDVDCLLPDTFLLATKYSTTYEGQFSTAFYMDDNGVLTTNVLTTEAERMAQRGVSPIMFI